MAAVILILGVLLTGINIGLALRSAWKEWHSWRQPDGHPLDAPLRDIAAAIRER